MRAVACRRSPASSFFRTRSETIGRLLADIQALWRQTELDAMFLFLLACPATTIQQNSDLNCCLVDSRTACIEFNVLSQQ
jgi:hypothetical protein